MLKPLLFNFATITFLQPLLLRFRLSRACNTCWASCRRFVSASPSGTCAAMTTPSRATDGRHAIRNILFFGNCYEEKEWNNHIIIEKIICISHTHTQTNKPKWICTSIKVVFIIIKKIFSTVSLSFLYLFCLFSFFYYMKDIRFAFMALTMLMPL